MKKNLLLTGALAFFAFTSLHAQMAIEVAVGKKVDGQIERIIKECKTTPTTQFAIKNATPNFVKVLIDCEDAAVVAEDLQAEGFHATNIDGKLVTAEVKAEYLATLAEREDVVRIEKARQFQSFMTEARELTGVDLLHNGTDLETPFTGKGVILGVVDQGFEYKHIAFMDDKNKSRVRAVWNRYKGSAATTAIPNGGDGMNDSHGHATHVTGIAAGSKIEENNYYGIAPNAEIIMIPSNFADAEVVEDVKYIKEFAEAEGKPWVINMSFGGLLGPHDGTASSDRAIEKLLGPGALVAAAMGNEGDEKVHASYTFTTDGETKYLLIDPNSCPEGITAIDIWGQAADARVHLTVKPFVYTASGQFDYKNSSFWASCSYTSAEINPYNKKEHYDIRASVESITNGKFGIAITGDAGQTFHAWTNPGYGAFTQPIGLNKSKFVPGDCKYCVSEGGATIPSAIAVGSYNSASTWYSEANKATVGSSGGNLSTVGAISYFSNSGPSLDGQEKPTVIAPGAYVKSAISKYTAGFNVKDPNITSIVTRGVNKYYYSAMMGTSMATPVVSGVLALWLEAYNELSPTQAKEVMKKTSKKDRYTDYAEWSDNAGYGKLDAYEGLKEVLKLAETSGINDMLNSEAPVTLSKGLAEWKVLFNNDESYANISLYSANGQLVSTKVLNNLQRGDEEVVSLADLAPGVYLISINTTASHMTRKVMVK